MALAAESDTLVAVGAECALGNLVGARSSFDDLTMVVRSLGGVVALLVVSSLSIGDAWADKLAVGDVGSDPELEAIAGGMTLVIRSYVGSKSQRVERGALATAVAAAAPNADGLAVPASEVGAVLEAVGGDKWLAGQLTRPGPVLALTLVAFGRDGKQLGSTELRAPLGDSDRLAKEAAVAAARLVGASTLREADTATFARLESAGRANARLGRQDFLGAARELAAAPARLGFELRAVAELARAVLTSESVPLELRMNATLVGGDLDEARRIAAAHPGDPRAKALAARVKLAQLDHRAARALLKDVKKSKDPFVALARAALAGELGRPKQLAESMGPLADGDPFIPALALASGLRPGALGDKVEEKFLRAAARVAASYPGLASQLAARALRSGARPPLAFELIDPLRVSSAGLKELKSALADVKDETLRERLVAEIAIREGDLSTAKESLRVVLNLNPNDGRAKRISALLVDTAIASGKETTDLAVDDAPASGAVAVELADPEKARKLKHLSDDLAPMLAKFSALDARLGRVVLVPFEGSRELPFWPTRVHPHRLRVGLEAALADAPYRLQASVEPSEIGLKPSRAQLSSIANNHSAGGVVAYGVRTDGFDAEVSLLVFVGASNTGEELRETLHDADEHGIVGWNPIVVVAAGVITSVLLLWLAWLIVRGSGTIRLEVKGDPAAERPSFSVKLARRNNCPVVTDPKLHIANVSSAAKSLRFGAHNVGAVTEFERIPPGTWFVHIYGTFEKAGETRCLAKTTLMTKVKRSRVSVVNADLVPKESEFHVLVTGEGGPAAGANIWLSTEPAKRYSADVGGKAVVFAASGEHTLHVAFRDLEVTRKLTAYGSKVTTIHLNLVRERRLAEVADGLEVNFENAPVRQPATAAPTIAQGGYPSLGEETPPPRPAPLGEAVPNEEGPSVESFRKAAAAATDVTSVDAALTGLRRYLAGDELGRGAMGVVYKAIDQVLDRPVALKVMTPELREHPAAASMFQQEAKALAALNHPNVVAVYDQGRDGDEVFMVMEFVDGPTLEQVLAERGCLPLLEAANIGEQIGRSLSYAHSRRVIHRDIKPGNVFLADDGSVKLGDFGLARILKEVQIKKTEIKGTPLYMPPEQIRGSDIDFRADIYALGCTMYEVLAGRPPFIDGEILWHHIYTEPDPLSKHVEVPADVEQLIMKCIAKDKADRIKSADRISEVFGAVRRRVG